MGWKISTIIVKDAQQITDDAVLSRLGFADLVKIDNQPFELVMNPADGHVYLGRFNNHLLICAPDLPLQLIEDDGTTPKVFNDLFPGSEICSLVLHSVVNLWAYSVIRNGVRLRARAGSADSGTFLDSGEPLDEEKELLSKASVNAEGERVYPSDYDDEPMTEDQMGEEFVFAVSERYFGLSIDHHNDDLMNTELTGYRYGSEAANQIRPLEGKVERKRKSTLWPGIMLVAVLLLVWQLLKNC